MGTWGMRLATILASLTFVSSESPIQPGTETAIKRLNEFKREYRANLNLDPDNLVSDPFKPPVWPNQPGELKKWQTTILKKSIDISRKMILDYEKRYEANPAGCDGAQELKPPKSTVGQKFLPSKSGSAISNEKYRRIFDGIKF